MKFHIIYIIDMSHIVSLRSASFRALRSSSTVGVTSKCTNYPNRPCQHQQQHYCYSTLPSKSNRITMSDHNNSTKKAQSDQTLSNESSHNSIYPIARRLHTSSICFDLVNVATPSFPESVKNGTIRILKKVGDKVFADEIIAEIETDKTNLNVNAPQAGIIEVLLVADGDNVTSGTQIAKLNTSHTVSKETESSNNSQRIIPNVPVERKTEESRKTSTSIKISNEQVKNEISILQKTDNVNKNKITGTRSETRVKMSGMRLKIAERLKEAQNTCAMLTTFNEIDLSTIVEFRKTYADRFLKRHNLKLGFMSAFIKASACALLDNPIVNAVIDGNEIVYRDYIDISVAVGSSKGLVVPVLRNVEKMSYADIERTINEFTEKANKNTLSIEDMDGGTFTISNGGVFGSLFGTPIINPPQSAILGMHGIFDKPVAVNGKVEIRPMMYVALTYDHRILDGRDAVLFLRKIKQYVEDSRNIFLNL